MKQIDCSRIFLSLFTIFLFPAYFWKHTACFLTSMSHTCVLNLVAAHLLVIYLWAFPILFPLFSVNMLCYFSTCILCALLLWELFDIWSLNFLACYAFCFRLLVLTICTWKIFIKGPYCITQLYFFYHYSKLFIRYYWSDKWMNSTGI